MHNSLPELLQIEYSCMRSILNKYGHQKIPRYNVWVLLNTMIFFQGPLGCPRVNSRQVSHWISVTPLRGLFVLLCLLKCESTSSTTTVYLRPSLILLTIWVATSPLLLLTRGDGWPVFLWNVNPWTSMGKIWGQTPSIFPTFHVNRSLVFTVPLLLFFDTPVFLSRLPFSV